MKESWLEVVEILDREPILYSFMRHCPLEVLRTMEVRRFAADEFLLKQGVCYNYFYFVASGEVEVFMDSQHGKKYIQAEYTKGTYFGELEIFEQLPYISSVRAITDVELIVLPRASYLKWMDADHLFLSYMMRSICATSYSMCVSMSDNILYSLKQRICKYLATEAKTLPGGELIVNITTEELSEKLAVTQRSVNRVLKELKEQGVTAMSKKEIKILDLAALELGQSGE